MAYVKMQKIPYYDNNTQQMQKNMNKIANMTDEQVLIESALKTKKEMDKSPSKIASKIVFPATIGALIADNVVKTKGSPSAKLAVGLGSLASWAILNKSFNIAQKVSLKASDNVKNENTKRGIMIGGMLAGGTALYLAASKVIGKGVNYLMGKIPGAEKHISKAALNFDNTVKSNGFVKAVKKNIASPLKNLAAKHPKLTKALSNNSKLIIMATGILAALGLAAKVANKEQKTFDKNIKEMMATREEVREINSLFSKAQNKYEQTVPDWFVADNAALIKTAEQRPEEMDETVQEIISDGMNGKFEE